MTFLLKYWYNIENVSQTIQPLCRCMKWFGFMPFTLVLRSETPPTTPALGEPRPLLVDLVMHPGDVLFLIGWQLYIGHMYFTDWIYATLEMPVSKIMICFTITLYFVQAAVLCSVQLLVAFSKAKIMRTLRLLEFTDDLLEHLSAGVNHRQQHLGSVLLILGSIICTTITFVTQWVLTKLFMDHISDLWLKFYNPMAVWYADALFSVQVCSLVTFIGGLLAFRSRYRKLNEFVCTHFNQQTESLNDEVVHRYLKCVAVCHDALTDAVELFCNTFSSLVVFACFTYMLFNIFSMFAIGALMSRPSINVLFVTLFYCVSDCLFSLHIIPIMKLGSDVRTEGTRMAVLVHRTINETPLSVNAIEQVNVFSGNKYVP
ncbi:uncharacterized protein LOC129732010 [Wyeomyia smithii]|uniref:uncharacterized protein LOC129732010 n=1 Tax=Wyeomyia smithii TaxID=174621 RepID=UPI0024680B93|nr:uncharacterized protein LOC129732010 [Wyeomyia smithii]